MKSIGEIGLELALGGVGGLTELAERVKTDLGPEVLREVYEHAETISGSPPNPDVLRFALRTAFLVEEFRAQKQQRPPGKVTAAAHLHE
jgi:hypothetical protein